MRNLNANEIDFVSGAECCKTVKELGQKLGKDFANWVEDVAEQVGEGLEKLAEGRENGFQ
ncbi:MAG: hypothetical protein AAFY42_02155 [Pseudomonadota bacterium]